jgi:predicted acetyltransferase
MFASGQRQTSACLRCGANEPDARCSQRYGQVMGTTRPTERRDVGQVARLAHDAYQHYTARIGRAPAPMTTDYAAVVSAGTMWIVEGDNRVLGFISS